MLTYTPVFRPDLETYLKGLVPNLYRWRANRAPALETGRGWLG